MGCFLWDSEGTPVFYFLLKSVIVRDSTVSEVRPISVHHQGPIWHSL